MSDFFVGFPDFRDHGAITFSEKALVELSIEFWTGYWEEFDRLQTFHQRSIDSIKFTKRLEFYCSSNGTRSFDRRLTITHVQWTVRP